MRRGGGDPNFQRGKLLSEQNPEDAILSVIRAVLWHSQKPKTYSRTLFLYFSSAFNTIQPHSLMRKLLDTDINAVIIRRLCSFLTDRPHRVVIGSSSVVRTNTGASQGCVLSPTLFTLSTSDCRCTAQDTLLMKFSDDTSLTGLITTSENENSFCCAVEKLVSWCRDNQLLLNVSKTREIVLDFMTVPPTPYPLVRNGEEVEIVVQYEYLSSIIDSKLDWSLVALALLKKGKHWLYLVKRLKSLNVPPKLLRCLIVPQVVGGGIQKPLSLRKPQRTGHEKAVQGQQDCQQAEWSTSRHTSS